MNTPRHKNAHKAKSHRQTWPALVPKPFPLICRRAPCLLVMRTGRKAGPSSLPAPWGQAACTNLNCVSSDTNSVAQKKTRRKRNRGKKITSHSLSLFLTVFIPPKCITSPHNQTRKHLFLVSPFPCRQLNLHCGLKSCSPNGRNLHCSESYLISLCECYWEEPWELLIATLMYIKRCHVFTDFPLILLLTPLVGKLLKFIFPMAQVKGLFHGVCAHMFNSPYVPLWAQVHMNTQATAYYCFYTHSATFWMILHLE